MSQNAEIITGLFREGQLITLSGGFRMGKSPLLLDWAFSITTGTPWCGRKVMPHPVVLLSHETPDWQFRPDWERLAAQRGVAPPCEPTMFEAFLEAGSEDSPATKELVDVICKPQSERFRWLEAKVLTKPNALLIIDPFDMFFRIEKKSIPIMEIYHFCRMLKRKSPLVTFLFTFNLRKKMRLAGQQPSLLDDPQDWLEEASGHLEIQTRSDVRLGLAHQGNSADGIRILNGVRRGSDSIEPMFLESRVVGESEEGYPLFAGYQPIKMSSLDLSLILSKTMERAWNEVADTFTLDDLENMGMTRSSAYRMIERLLNAGVAKKVEKGVWKKEFHP